MNEVLFIGTYPGLPFVPEVPVVVVVVFGSTPPSPLLAVVVVAAAPKPPPNPNPPAIQFERPYKYTGFLSLITFCF